MSRVNEGMRVSPAGLALVMKWEGLVRKAARCPEGVPTAGWGHTGHDVALGETYSISQCQDWLRADMAEHGEAVISVTRVKLSQPQFDVLSSWSFNVGKGWVTGKGHEQATLIKQLNAGNYEAVPGQLLRFSRGANSGDHIDGLYNRRLDEAKVWANGSTSFPTGIPDAITTPAAQAVAPAQGPVSLSGSRTVLGTLYAATGALFHVTGAAILKPLSFVAFFLAETLDMWPEVAARADQLKGTVSRVAQAANLHLPESFGLIVLAAGLGLVLYARYDAAKNGKIG